MNFDELNRVDVDKMVIFYRWIWWSGIQSAISGCSQNFILEIDDEKNCMRRQYLVMINDYLDDLMVEEVPKRRQKRDCQMKSEYLNARRWSYILVPKI